MNLTLSLDAQLLEKARKRAAETGTTVNQMVRDYLQSVIGEGDLRTELAFLERTAGQGKPDADWQWNREQIYEERLIRYGKS